MTSGLDNRKATILTVLVYFLMSILTAGGVLQQYWIAQLSGKVAAAEQRVSELPNEYVRLERYQSDKQRDREDTARIHNELKCIADKLDRLIEREKVH